MEIIGKPVRTTIIYGLLCAIVFIPASTLLNNFFFWPIAFRLTLWTFLVIYSVLLVRWGNARITSALFPLLFLLAINFMEIQQTTFMFFLMFVLSWIRSGVCFKTSIPKTICLEAFICIGGGAVLLYLSPFGIISWATGIWLFFLVQSMYFPFTGVTNYNEEKIEADAFDQAKRHAEKILADKYFV